MDLPINDKELATIVSALRLGGDTSLSKTKIDQEIRELTQVVLTKKLPEKNLDLLFNGLLKRDCKRNW